MRLKNWLLLAVALLLPYSAYAEMNSEANPTQPYINISGSNQVDGVNINPNTAAPGNFTNLTVSGTTTNSGAQTFSSSTTFNGPVAFNSTVAPQGTVYSSTITGNPLVLQNVTSLSLASVNTPTSFLSGVAGRTIYPNGGLTIMASGGAAAGATQIKIMCVPSNRTIAGFNIAALASGIPVNAFISNGGTALTFASNGLTQGCVSGDSVQASNVGAALTGPSAILINMPYTLQ